MKNSKVIMMVLALVGFAITASAAETKVGYVDLQKAIQSSVAGKKAKDQLDGEFKKRKETLDKKKADIEKMGQDLEKKKAVLSEEVFGKKQLELQEEMMKFQKVIAENQLEMEKKQGELLEPIFSKMSKVVEKVAHEKGYSMVLERKGQSVLFAEKAVDLTDDVITTFEKEK
jgi:outer membrane protein